MKNKIEQEGLKAIDLFCGAGGSSYGARKAGAQIVAGFDMWSSATLAYQTNFPEAKVYQNDLRDLMPEKIKGEIGEIDLILASPECTNHSLAKGAKERCEESKRTAFQVTRYAKVFRPKWIIIENVVEMQSWSEHPKFIDGLWSLKYSVQQVKLNAAEFGVPQARKRLFLICTNTDKVEINKYSHIKTKPKAVSTVIDWSSKYAFTPLFKKGRAENSLKRAANAIDTVGKKEPFIMVYYGTGDGWQNIDKPLRTITTLDRFALVIPTTKGHQMRMLQPEELKLAMGFQKDYDLNIGITRREKIKLMGNGVCPPVMTSIVESLFQSKNYSGPS
jgi:DNA (cytosine-5)-methyltransferase 1